MGESAGRAHHDSMAGVTGLEPAASGVTGRRSNRLSYTPEAWCPRSEAGLTPQVPAVKRAARSVGCQALAQIPVGGDGFEPPTSTV
ncbi:hypothetical protein DF3PA_10041 [Candidatus Defluviicoccus seviourii]|uniref:Uncharacterized protein n=2 Tax=root TaxID=1 RepID=A0A564W903_9PROT|nr:hypothetical protein DF3PB_2780001 [uncultured Defluviicoccus sp.]VUX44916.1 hypothetical protein DF3PA_10041 [Candidatus Defluviicoccus seviourii]